MITAKAATMDTVESRPRVKVVEYRTEEGSRERMVSTTNELLDSIQDEYINGLDVVVLRDVLSLTRAERKQELGSRGSSITRAEINGLYQPAKSGSGAQIELFIDQIFGGLPRWAPSIPVVRRLLLGRVLFHEIGHHVQRTRKLKGDKERIANRWAGIFLRQYAEKRHPLLSRSLGWITWILRATVPIVNGLSRMFQKGPQ